MKNILTALFILFCFASFGQTISSLPAATTLGGTEVSPGVQGGVTKKISMNQIKTFNWDLSPAIDVGDTITYVLVRRTSDGKIYRRSVASIGAGYLPLTLTGNTTVDGVEDNSLHFENMFSFDIESSGGGTGAFYLDSTLVQFFSPTSSIELTSDGVGIGVQAGSDMRINADPGSSGEVLTSQGANNPPIWAPAASGGHTIEEEGTSLTQRTKLNFVGSGVTVTDDSGDDASVVTIPLHTVNTSSALTDGSTITITGTKHTLTSDEATITWTLSQTTDFQTTDIILNATTTTWTFPANALCVVEGIASGTNTAALAGVSGDHYIMSIYKDGTNYRIVIKNFGQ